MKASSAPAAVGAMLYHSMLTQVLTCATSFHQLYSMMKLAAVGMAQPRNASDTNTRMKTRIWEGRIKAILACPAVAPLPAKTIFSDAASPLGQVVESYHSRHAEEAAGHLPHMELRRC